MRKSHQGGEIKNNQQIFLSSTLQYQYCSHYTDSAKQLPQLSLRLTFISLLHFCMRSERRELDQRKQEFQVVRAQLQCSLKLNISTLTLILINSNSHECNQYSGRKNGWVLFDGLPKNVKKVHGICNYKFCFYILLLRGKIRS